jgi:hypothetical protein
MIIYKIISSSSIPGLEYDVQSALDKGMMLVGAPWPLNGHFYQALSGRSEPDKIPDKKPSAPFSRPQQQQGKR